MVYYVYIYFDVRPGKVDQPIYVGKGSKSRACRHWLKGTLNRRLKSKLQKIRALGLEPKIVLWRCFRDEASAYESERYLIAKYGRLDLGTGTLTNADDGGGPGVRKIVYTPAIRQRISIAVKAAFADPLKRIAKAEAARKANKVPQRRAKISRSMKQRWQEHRVVLMEARARAWRDPVRRERMCAGLVKGRSAEAHMKTSATLKIFYADPSNRKAMSERISKAYRNPVILHQRQERQQATEFREQASRKAKQAWGDPAIRAKYLATSKSKSAKLKAAWANPEIRARIIAGQRAAI